MAVLYAYEMTVDMFVIGWGIGYSKRMYTLLAREKVRFAMAGAANTIVDFIILNILVFGMGVVPLMANTISVSTGIGMSYFLNHFFVFGSKEKVSFKKIFYFFGVSGVGYLLIQNITLEVSQHLLSEMGRDWEEGVMLNVAKIAATGVGMVWNYTLYKYFIFKRTGSQAV